MESCTGRLDAQDEASDPRIDLGPRRTGRSFDDHELGTRDGPPTADVAHGIFVQHGIQSIGILASIRPLELLADPPPIDRLVVCHGDACAPNTLIGEDGECSGHVDMGQLGVADRWADIAIATWSTTWKYGPGWQDLLLDAYGIAPDLERTAYYRLVWDLGP